MAVFEYRGILATSGKQVHGIRDADNAKVLRGRSSSARHFC